jgi:hypothetical protein
VSRSELLQLPKLVYGKWVLKSLTKIENMNKYNEELKQAMYEYNQALLELSKALDNLNESQQKMADKMENIIKFLNN